MSFRINVIDVVEKYIKWLIKKYLYYNTYIKNILLILIKLELVWLLRKWRLRSFLDGGSRNYKSQSQRAASQPLLTSLSRVWPFGRLAVPRNKSKLHSANPGSWRGGCGHLAREHGHELAVSISSVATAALNQISRMSRLRGAARKRKRQPCSACACSLLPSWSSPSTRGG